MTLPQVADILKLMGVRCTYDGVELFVPGLDFYEQNGNISFATTRLDCDGKQISRSVGTIDEPQFTSRLFAAILGNGKLSELDRTKLVSSLSNIGINVCWRTLTRIDATGTRIRHEISVD